jgi:hypothetical protein
MSELLSLVDHEESRRQQLIISLGKSSGKIASMIAVAMTDVVGDCEYRG